MVLLGLFALNSLFVVQDWFQIFLELIACIIFAVVVYLVWIRLLLPSMALFDTFDRPSEIAQITDPEKLLRLIQAQHSAILGVVTIIDWTVFVFFLVAVTAVSRWLTTRTDDRNWTHGGIRPPPEADTHETAQPTDP